MDERLSWLNHSWPIWRTRTTCVRISLFLVLVAVLFGLDAGKWYGWTYLPVGMGLFVVAMVLHAIAHLLVIRLVGGQSSEMTANALTEESAAFIPPRAWPIFASAFAGPLANGIAAIAAWQAQTYTPFWLHTSLSLWLQTNAIVAILNCLACWPFDGRQFWRGLLWPFLGVRLAGGTALVLAYISVLLMFAYGLLGPKTDLLWVIMAIVSGIMTVRDHRVFRSGMDPAIDLVPDRPQPSFWDRWSRRRAEAAQARQERQEADEQEVLDRLLAKVSAEGLPSLTAGERATLQRISQRQKERAGR